MKKAFSIILAVLLTLQLIPALSFNAAGNDYAVKIKVSQGTQWKDSSSTGHDTVIVEFQVKGTSLNASSSAFIAYDNTKLCLVDFKDDYTNEGYLVSDSNSGIVLSSEAFVNTTSYYVSVKEKVGSKNPTDEWKEVGSGISFADIRRINNTDYIRLSASQSKTVTYSELTTIISIRLAVISGDFSTDSIRLLTADDRTTLGIGSSEVINANGTQYSYPQSVGAQALATPTIEFDISRTIKIDSTMVSAIESAFTPVAGEDFLTSYAPTGAGYTVTATWKQKNDNNEQYNVNVGSTDKVVAGKKYKASFTVEAADKVTFEKDSSASKVTLGNNNKQATFTSEAYTAAGKVGEIDISTFLETYKPSYVDGQTKTLKTDSCTLNGKNYKVDSASWEVGSQSVSGNVEPGTVYKATFKIVPNDNYTFKASTDMTYVNGSVAVSADDVSYVSSGEVTIKYTYTDATAKASIATTGVDVASTSDLTVTYGDAIGVSGLSVSAPADAKYGVAIEGTSIYSNDSGTVTTDTTFGTGTYYVKIKATISDTDKYKFSDESTEFYFYKAITVQATEISSITLTGLNNDGKYEVTNGDTISAFNATVDTNAVYEVSTTVIKVQNDSQQWVDPTTTTFEFGKTYKAIVTAAIKSANSSTHTFAANANTKEVFIVVNTATINDFNVAEILTDITPAGGSEFKTSTTKTLTNITVGNTISWTQGSNAASGNADYNTTYKATITFTPNSGYKFVSGTTKVKNGLNEITTGVTFETNGSITLVSEFTTAKESLSGITANDITITYTDTTNNKVYHDDPVTNVTFSVGESVNYSIGTGEYATVIECSTDSGANWNTYSAANFSLATGNETYRAKITLVPNENATFNPEEGKPDVLVVYKDITVDSAVISAFSLTGLNNDGKYEVTNGDTIIAFYATVDNDAVYEVSTTVIKVQNDSQQWVDPTTTTFEFGKTYKATVTAAIKSTYSSTHSFAANANTKEVFIVVNPATIQDFDVAEVLTEITPAGGSAFTTSTTKTLTNITVGNTISWTQGSNAASGNADYNTTYKATITFTPNSGYKFVSGTTKVKNGDNVITTGVTFETNGSITLVSEFTTAKEVLSGITESNITITYTDTTNNKAYHDDPVTNVSFAVPEGAHYSIGTDTNATEIEQSTDSGSTWETYSGEKFSFANGNETYRAKITLVPNEKATFSPAQGQPDTLVVYKTIVVAKKVLTEIPVTFTIPQVGKTVSYAKVNNAPAVNALFSGVSVKSSTLAFKESSALDDTAVFAKNDGEGTKYKVYMEFEVADGYEISNTATVKINDATATAISKSGTEAPYTYSYEYAFNATALTAINSAIVITNVVEPVGSAAPSTTATLPTGSELHYSLATTNGTVWTEKDNSEWTGTAFSYGKTYKITFTFVADEGYCFDSTYYTSTNVPMINGYTAAATFDNNNQTMKVSCEFTAPNQVISAITGLVFDNDFANYTALQGKDFTYNAETPLYDITTKWWDASLGTPDYVDSSAITLKPATTYTVKVELAAKDGYEFKALSEYSFSSYTAFTVDTTNSSVTEDKKTLTLIASVGPTPEAEYTMTSNAKIIYKYNYVIDQDTTITVTASSIWTSDTLVINDDTNALVFSTQDNVTKATYTVTAANMTTYLTDTDGDGESYDFKLKEGSTEKASITFTRAPVPEITSVVVDKPTVTSAGGDVKVTISGNNFVYQSDVDQLASNVYPLYLNIYKNGSATPLNNTPIKPTAAKQIEYYTYTYTFAESESGIDTYEFRAKIGSLTEETTYTATVKQFVGGTFDLVTEQSYTKGQSIDKSLSDITANSAIAVGDKIEFKVTVNDTVKFNSVKIDGDSVDFTYDSTNKILTVTAGAAVAKDATFTVAANITYGVIDVESIEITNDKDIMTIGEELTLTVDVTPTDATDKAITFESSNEDAATIDTDGKIVAKAKGITTIKATSVNGKTDEFKLYVSDKQITTRVTGLEFQSDAVTLNRYTVRKFYVTVSPSNASDPSVTWSSSDESIAYVDSNGYIHAKKNGTCTITATSNDGFKTASCEVTVKSLISMRVIVDFFDAYLEAMDSFIDFIVNIGRN